MAVLVVRDSASSANHAPCVHPRWPAGRAAGWSTARTSRSRSAATPMALASSSACSDGSLRSPRSTARLARPRTHFALTLHLCSAPRQGGRAEAAGLQTWDRIKSVNGEPLFESRDGAGWKELPVKAKGQGEAARCRQSISHGRPPFHDGHVRSHGNCEFLAQATWRSFSPARRRWPCS